MTDYKLACPDCSHDASEHGDEHYEHCIRENGWCCTCLRPKADIYAEECARLDRDLTAVQGAFEGMKNLRDAARAECEWMRDERRMANRPVLVTEWDLLVAERDRYKAALELILKIDSYTAGAKDIASTALDADRETDNG